MTQCKKFFEIIIFLAVILLIFHMTFQVAGKYLRHGMALLLDDVTRCIDTCLSDWGIHAALHSLIIDGICTGIGSVLSFVPLIAILFFFLSLLEETGYLFHVSLLLDTPLRRIGLAGGSFLPMIMGFGCSVPAIMAAASLSEKKERYATMLLIPFMSCSAKLPIYGLLASAFFSEHLTAVIFSVYLVGVGIAVLCSLFLNRILPFPRIAPPAAFRSERSTPLSFRIPSLKKIMLPVIGSCVGFVKKAFTIILLASILVWFLQSYSPRLQMVSDMQDSILAYLGTLAAPLFAPLGFDDWRAAAALIAGISAKEAVVSTLAVLPGPLTEIFTPASAFSFMVFCLLYVPCIATLAVVKKQTGCIGYSLAMFSGQIILAWILSFFVFQSCRIASVLLF